MKRRPVLPVGPDADYLRAIEDKLTGDTLDEFRKRYRCLHDKAHFAGVRPCVDLVIEAMREDRVKGLPVVTSWRAA
jgi:hypothetical protein